MLFSLFRRCKNRWNLYALLSANLFDEETRLKSNVWGRGKDKLDPDIIQYIEPKCFMYHLSDGNPTAEWERCIKSIDVKSRAIKKEKGKNYQNSYEICHIDLVLHVASYQVLTYYSSCFLIHSLD